MKQVKQSNILAQNFNEDWGKPFELVKKQNIFFF